jgi:PKD repeat protein
VRKIKIIVLTALAIASLFSLRDKEVVITVPDTKPLVAEAYQPPDSDLAGALQGTQKTQAAGTGAISSAALSSAGGSSSDTGSPYYTPDQGDQQGYSPNGSTTSPAVGLIQADAMTSSSSSNQQDSSGNNQIVYFGLGATTDDGNDDGSTGGGTTPTGANSAPVIDSFQPELTTPSVNEGGSLAFSVTAHDPDGGALSYAWLLDGSGVSANVSSWTYNPDYSSSGSRTVKVTVSDGTDSDEQIWTVTVNDVVPSNEPIVNELLPESGIEGVSVMIQGANFSDTASSNTVKFGATQAASVEAIAGGNQLRAEVPAGLSAGFKDLSVAVNGAPSNNYLFDSLRDTSANIFKDKSSELLQGLSSELLQGLNISGVSIVRPLDFDDDKDIDLLVIGAVDDRVILLINDGTGRFTDGSAKFGLMAVSSPSSLTDAKAGDFDFDGYPDIVLTYSSGQAVRLLMNEASGADRVFNDRTSLNIPLLSGAAVKADPGDADGDGDLDIVVAFNGSKDILLLNNGLGILTKDGNFNLPEVPDSSSDIIFCDVDNDGDMDIITTNNDSVGQSLLQNRIYINDGSGSFTDETTQRLPDENRYTEVLDVGDIDRDGSIDIIFADGLQDSVLINNGDGTFMDNTAQSVPYNGFSSVDTKLADMDGDGYLDAVVLGDSAISLFINDGTGSFKKDASIKLPDYNSYPARIGGESIAIADINGDGALDIIIGGAALNLLVNTSENKPPVLNSIGTRQVEAGHNLTFNVSASDPNGDPLEILTENKPTGASFSNNLFDWTPGLSEVGDKIIRFIARETSTSPKLEDTEDVTITVTSSNLPVIDYYIPPELDLEIGEGQIVQFGVNAHDPLNGQLTFKWFLNGAEIPSIPGADSSIIFIVPRNGSNTIEVKVTNSAGTAAVSWNLWAGPSSNQPPTITSYLPTETVQNIDLSAGAGLSFGVTATDPEGDNLIYTWLVDNSPIATGANLSSSANAMGLKAGTDYTLTVSVSDSHNTPVTHSWTLHVTQGPAQPAAQFTAAPTSGDKPLTVQFTDSSTGQIASRSWTFGDGGTSTAQSPSHQYTIAGDYTVSLTVTGPNGSDTETKTSYIHVAEPAIIPTAQFTAAPTSGDKPLTVQFTDSSTGQIASRSWTFGDGGTSTAQSPSHQYTVAGDYTVSLTVTGPGGSDTETKTNYIHVSEPAQLPIANDDTDTATQATPKIINVLANDSNLSADPHVSIMSGAANGGLIVNADNTVTYTPSTSFTGNDGFTYRVTNSAGTSNTATVTITVQTLEEAVEDIISGSFGYFWYETDNPSTGFIRDRLLVNAPDPTVDPQFNKASMAATGFGLAALCIAAENYGDGTNPDWPISKADIADRVNLILDTLLHIQANQAPGGDSTWGKDGFFYHFVSLENGERWVGSEVSSIDTAIVVAGALAAGEYFESYDSDINTKAQQIYRNINWKSFIDDNPGSNYGRFYKQWMQGSGYNNGHWDYTDESLLLYLLAIGSPKTEYAIDADCYYAPWRDLGNYGTGGKPIVQTWFGSLFAYQFPYVFFDLRNMHDARNLDWWQNSTEAAIANRQFCLDQDGVYGYNNRVWGISSAYDVGALYRGEFGAPPLENPSGPTHNGTINPSAVLAALPMLPTEAGEALAWLKSDPKLWHGEKYGFVDSFKNFSTPVYSDYYVGIDLGYSIVMASNHETGLIWNNFMNAATRYGTMKDLLTSLNFRQNSDPKSYIDLDDITAKSQFSYGFISKDQPTAQTSFNLQSVVPNSVYLLTIHAVMNNYAGTYDATVNLNLNGVAGGTGTFSHTQDVEDDIIYIEIGSEFLQTGENAITFTWQDGVSWFAWKNIEVSSPIINNEWTITRSVYGNEYRLDDTYYAGHFTKHGADAYKTFEQALNSEADPYTDILFYIDDLNHDRKLTLTDESSDGTVYVDVLTNDQLTVDDVVMNSTQVVTIPATLLRTGWNVIRLKIDNHGGKWIIWDTVKLELGSAVRPQAPTGLVSAPFGPDVINLRWAAVNGTDVRYNIYRSQAPGGLYVKLNSGDLTSTQYQDTALQNSTIYYYVVTAFEQNSSAGESDYSVPTASKTGEWALDYGDGMDPNAFGGTNIANIIYEQGTIPGGAAGYVRKVTLGGDAQAGLNSANLGQAAMLSMYLKGTTGAETFKIGLKDASGNVFYVDFSNPSTTWTPVNINLTKFEGVSLASLSQLIVTSTGPATLYLYDIRFKSQAVSTMLKIEPVNISDQTLSTGVHFTNIDPTQVSQYKLADQAIKVTYNPPNSGESVAVWKMRLYTDNSDADMQVLPYQRNGLLNQNKKCTVPLKWKAFNDFQGAGAVQFTEGSADSWTYLKDKNDLDIPGTPQDESWDGANVHNQEYTVVAYGSNNVWESWSQLNDNTRCQSPVYVYAGSIFKGTVGGQQIVAAAGDYNTTICFELYHE